VEHHAACTTCLVHHYAIDQAAAATSAVYFAEGWCIRTAYKPMVYIAVAVVSESASKIIT
jgi:hypothetical protein